MSATRRDDNAILTSSIVQKHASNSTRLIQILREVQIAYGYIPATAIEQIVSILNIPYTHVAGVIEFYSFLHLQPRGRYRILLSDSISDHMLGKRVLMDYFCEKLGIKPGETRADGQVSIDNTSCTGMCDQGPAGLINGYTITNLDRARIDQIVSLIKQRIQLDEWPLQFFRVDDHICKRDILLNNRIDNGLGLKTAYERGLKKSLAELEIAGLRGRGGAGFSTSLKWKICGETEGSHYVVCNADEGEPGTFKDRVLLNSYSHEMIEGMTLCAAVLGAKQGFLYLRGEYLYLYEKLQNILQERRQSGLLGKKILGQEFDFDIGIHLGAGAYICGEESALIESLEGKRGIPRSRPPYPVTRGYLDAPTVVDNPETFVAAAHIILKGGDWFAAQGTKQSKGTKILSISGDCEQRGIYEYPFGTKVQDILDDCRAHDVLGVQIGGPAGSFISNRELDRRISFEDLSTGGSFMVFNQSRDVLEIVRNFTHFFAHESCGFCTPCRVGTSVLAEQLDKLCSGQKVEVSELKKIGELMKQTSHCGLGQTAANPILSTLTRYPELYGPI